MALCTRRAVAGATEPLPLTTREAVPRPTRARRATSLMVAMRRGQAGGGYASLARGGGNISTPPRVLKDNPGVGSEERRVGEEGRYRGGPHHLKKKKEKQR